MHINFKSRYSQNFSHTASRLHRSISWSEWDSISQYSGGDARHIIWKKSTTWQISEKNFADYSGISLIFANIFDNSDNFEYWNYPSKWKFKEKLQKILIKNAKLQKIPYKNYNENNLENFCKKILEEKIAKNLIIIFCSEFHFWSEKLLNKICELNEIIFIFPYHFFEKNPENSLLLEWKIFDKKNLVKYQQKITENEAKMKKFFTEKKSHFLTIETTENIESTLNYFFKNEYK